MQRLTYDDVIQHKKLNDKELQDDIKKLIKYNANENKRCFYGNNFIYHYQLVNIGKVKINNKNSLYDVMKNDLLYEKLWNNMIRLNRTGTIPNRLFEAFRFNSCVAVFKATTAKYIYKKYNATHVLDPTAGWGGRMLGAHSLNIHYTGFDTNVNMMDSYNGMIDFLKDDKLIMNYQNCLDADFSTIDYDFVLTSPPYINIETYECMNPFESNEAYYKQFLIPLITKCLKHIKRGGYVCFNISPNMYDDLIKYGFQPCIHEEDLLQQKRLGKNKQDKIYFWK